MLTRSERGRFTFRSPAGNGDAHDALIGDPDQIAPGARMADELQNRVRRCGVRRCEVRRCEVRGCEVRGYGCEERRCEVRSYGFEVQRQLQHQWPP
jgi:hypothetical protein